MLKQNIVSPMFHTLGSNNLTPLTLEGLYEFLDKNREIIANPSKQNMNSDYEVVVITKQLKENESERISHLPDKLSEIFNINSNNLIRVGVINYIPSIKNNISFVSSLITCLDSSYSTKSEEEQFLYIKSIFEHIKANINALMKDIKTKKNDIIKKIFNYTIDDDIRKICTNLFHVNIFIIDIQNDRLEFINNTFIPYKKNIFIIKIKDDIYEPVFFNDKKFLQYNSNLINNLIDNPELVYNMVLNVEIEDISNYLQKNDTKMDIKEKILMRKMGLVEDKQENKLVTTEDNDDIKSDKFEEMNTCDDEASEIEDISDSEIFISKKKYTEKELKAMKKAELESIASSLDIELTHYVKNRKRPKTKKILIENILEENN